MQHHLLELASEHVRTLFRDRLTPAYTYHNYDHTQGVVGSALAIGRECGLADEDLLAVLLAAWFHDTGVTETYIDHEERSAEIAERFLRLNAYPDNRIAIVKTCILATDLGKKPESLAEMVLCDADLLHLASDTFWDYAKLLRSEWESVLGHSYTNEQWLRKQIDFMKEQSFHTASVIQAHGDGFAKNIRKLEKKFEKKYSTEDSDVITVPLAVESVKDGGSSGGKEKGGGKVKDDFLGRGDRGVETMFRITSRNHVEFSSMVDSKANIMISINALVISVVISVLFRKLDSNPYMTIPTFIFLAVCLTTIVYAVLASRPKVTSGLFTREDITQKRANLLFFGNFYNVPAEDFEWGMKEMLKDKEYLYGSMIKDFYYLGQVLGKKYHYLRISYNVFMYGFVASIIIYVIMFLVTSQNPLDMLPW